MVEVRQSGRGKLSGVSVEETLYHVWETRGDKAVGMRAFTTREDAFAAAGHSN